MKKIFKLSLLLFAFLSALLIIFSAFKYAFSSLVVPNNTLSVFSITHIIHFLILLFFALFFSSTFAILINSALSLFFNINDELLIEIYYLLFLIAVIISALLSFTYEEFTAIVTTLGFVGIFFSLFSSKLTNAYKVLKEKRQHHEDN